MVELPGHTRRQGLHALNENTSLAQLFSSEDILGTDIHPLIGVIERTDREQITKLLIDFPLRLVLKGQYDEPLREGDVVHLFSTEDIEDLAEEEKPEDGEELSEDAEEETKPLDKKIVEYLKERSVFVRGAVRNPGPYPVSEDQRSITPSPPPAASRSRPITAM